MAASEASPAALVSSSARLRLEKLFFPFMAMLIIGAVFLGFARTFFLAPIYHYHLPNLLVAVHGVVFASWIALFAIQTSLVAIGRVDLHRKLGVLGAILVGFVFVLAYAVMLEGVHRDFTFKGQGNSQILALDVVGINFSFAMFVAGLLLRRKPEAHKRLMFLGTVAMVGPAVARWPFDFISGHPPLVGVVLLSFAFATILFDAVTMRRVHRATWVGTAGIFLVPPIAIAMSNTPFWHHLLASLKQLFA